MVPQPTELSGPNPSHNSSLSLTSAQMLSPSFICPGAPSLTTHTRYLPAGPSALMAPGACSSDGLMAAGLRASGLDPCGGEMLDAPDFVGLGLSVWKTNRLDWNHVFFIDWTIIHYRPQTKFAKVMFLDLSVSHSVHRGRGSTWAGTLPPGRYAPW